MPSNIGNQKVTLKYHDVATTVHVNQRFEDIRPCGIYKGGYLTRVSDTSVSLSPVVTEIRDADNQVRGETQDTIPSITVSTVNNYVILRWHYTGVAVDDYMEILAVPYASISANDLVVGSCVYTGSVITGMSYEHRSNPCVQGLFLKVEPTENAELKVHIRAGQYQTESELKPIADQVSTTLTAPSSHPKIFLVYINDAGAVGIDMSGVEASPPTAPDYDQRMILAEITLPVGAVDIIEPYIKDTRTFLTPSKLRTMPVTVDDTTISKNVSGELQKQIGIIQIARWTGISPFLDDGGFGSPSTAISQGSQVWGSLAHGLATTPDFVHVNLVNPANGIHVDVSATGAYWDTNAGYMYGASLWDDTYVKWCLMGRLIGHNAPAFNIDNTWRIEIVAGHYKF